MHLVGQVAPLFEAPCFNPAKNEISTVSLEDLKGQWVILFFYPLNFSSVCPSELIALAKVQDEFKKLNAELLTVSVDSAYSHKAWVGAELKEQNIKFKLLSDLTKRMSRDYGVLDEDAGIALRGSFIIDPEGKVQYHLCHNLKTARNIPELVETLKALQSPNACMANWNY